MGVVLSKCGRNCLTPKWYPRYCTLCPTAYFFGLAVSLPASETPGLQPLAAHAVDYDIIQVGGGICSVWMQHLVHKELERGRRSEQPEWKCDKLVQTAQSGRPFVKISVVKKMCLTRSSLTRALDKHQTATLHSLCSGQHRTI